VALADETPATWYQVYDLVGGVDRRPIGWQRRVRRRVENLPPLWGGFLVAGVAVGLYVGALGGVSLALAGGGSLLDVLLGVPILLGSAAVAAHLTPPRISELRE
jgi:hypothetical protein